jgi:hypothetical protein
MKGKADAKKGKQTDEKTEKSMQQKLKKIRNSK